MRVSLQIPGDYPGPRDHCHGLRVAAQRGRGAAKAALDRADAAGAGQFAAESLKAAQDAGAALDAELKAQEGQWFKSYDKARELALAAKAAGDKAAADAVAGKEKADAFAAKENADAAAKAKAKAKAAAVHVGGKVKAPTKIKDVKPVYPAIAQSAHVAGAVAIEATIGPDGKVIDAKVVRSIPLLNQAALDAVRRWEYTPTLLNGVSVPVLVTVTINFTRESVSGPREASSTRPGTGPSCSRPPCRAATFREPPTTRLSIPAPCHPSGPPWRARRRCRYREPGCWWFPRRRRPTRCSGTGRPRSGSWS